MDTIAMKTAKTSETPLRQRVWAVTRTIPKGKVSTYGAVAKALKSGPRAVGQALKCNPYAPAVPCHRVIASDGSLGGYNGSNPQKIAKKMRLLQAEGVAVQAGKIDLGVFGWAPTPGLRQKR